MKATLTNFDWDPPSPFIHHQRLIKNRPKESCLLLHLVLLSNQVPSRQSRGRNLILPFVKNWFLKSDLCIVPRTTKLSRVCQDGFTSGNPKFQAFILCHPPKVKLQNVLIARRIKESNIMCHHLPCLSNVSPNLGTTFDGKSWGEHLGRRWTPFAMPRRSQLVISIP